MSVAMSAMTGGVRSPSALLREVIRRQPALAILGLLLLAAVVPTSFGAVLDPELFGGANKWFKPMRFQASLGMLMLTLAWCAGYLLPTRRAARWLRWAVPVAITASLYEAGYITWQAAHGEASHWNVGDPLHRILWALMGVGAVPLTYIAFALALALHRDGDPRLPPAFRLSLVLGLALTFVLGASTGALLGVYGSHSVGHLPPEPGLPLFGWSTVGGDWRPAHFFGMHAGQVVPAFGAFVAWLGIGRSIAAVGVFAGAYAALTLLCLLQAYRNHPFIAL